MKPFAIVLLNYRFPEITEACLESLAQGDTRLFTVYLVNNHAADGSGPRLVQALSRLGISHRYLEMSENLGFAGGVNAGLRAALQEGHDWMVLLNNDTVVLPDFAERVQREAARYPGSALGALILDARTGLPSFGIGRIGRWMFRVRHILDAAYEGPVDFASGCFLALSREALETVGLFREDYFMYAEDVEFCLRLREAGIPVHFCPDIRVRHRVGETSDRAGTPKDYYGIRNHTRTVLEHGNGLQKLLYAVYMTALTGYQLRRPRMAVTFLRAMRDAVRGKMGKVPD